MSYSGNMPDWHQYNPPQHGRATTTSGGQNVNSSQLFLSSINPAPAPPVDTINLTTTDRQSKHQRNEVNYQARNYQQAGSIPNSSAPVHMAPLSSCVSHYGTSPSRSSLMESISGTMDPRLGTVGALNDTDLPHRNPQMSFNTTTSHASTTSMSAIHHGSMASQTSPVGPMSPNRQMPYPACKGPCCNPDASVAYQHWEKYGHYQAPAAYRDNIRSGAYPMENRRYVPEMGLRKDCHESKEIVGAGFGLNNRRSYQDYKYQKEMARNYSASSLLPNYPMQHYNFPPPDCQKCPHTVKDYLRRGNTNGAPQNQGIIKYPEQQSVIVQQKYNGKQISYQNGAVSSAMPNTSSSNLSTALQNSYFNAQLPREMPRDFSRDYTDPSNVTSRLPSSPSSTALQGSYQKYHAYQQKIAMQRYSIESHLRAMQRIPGYQSHPKYQEYMLRFRELVRLQQNVDYQGVLHDTAKIPSPPSTTVPPINLQFDQNGVLINSTYNPGHFPMHNPANPANSTAENPENIDTNQIHVAPGSIESSHHYLKHTDQTLNLSRDVSNIHHTNDHHPDRYLMQKDRNNREQFDNLIVDVDVLDASRAITTVIPTMSTTTTSIMMENASAFSDKPQLDVRQFLANWDETEEEEALSNLPKHPANNSTSVIVADCSSSASTNDQEKSVKPQKQKEPKEKPEEVVTTVMDANVIIQEGVENIDVSRLTTIEELAQSGTIVQCIQTDTDDIPTIHIVDHLPENPGLTTIQAVYGDVSSLTIEDITKAPIEIINETPNGTESITIYETNVGAKAPEQSEAITTEVNTVKEVISNIDNPISTSEPAETSTNISPEKESSKTSEKPTEQPVQSTAASTLPAETHQPSNLKKQHSFPSEESHNPDDISLPDIPMSECTPMSTTLNTPIHSDTEETSEHGTALEMSTNPIEVVQNSPIISFTHSPIKIDPYVHLESNRRAEIRSDDSLDFDFPAGENSKSKFGSKTLEEFEIARRSPPSNVNDLIDDKNADQGKESTIDSRESEKEFYPCSDPLVSMGQSPSMPSKTTQDTSSGIVDMPNTIIQASDFSVDALGSETRPGTPVSRILSPDEIDTGRCPSIIDTEDLQPSEDLEKLCNISLDGSCMMPLMAQDHTEESRLAHGSMDDRCLTKIMKDVGPISEMDVLESSDDDQLDKDDAWIEVRALDEEIIMPTDLSVNKTSNKSPNYSVKSPIRELTHSNEIASTSVNILEPAKPQKNTANNPKVQSKPKINKFSDKDARTMRRNYIPSIFDISGDSQSTDFDKFERKRREKFNKDLLKSKDKLPVKDNDEGHCQDQQDNNTQASSISSSVSTVIKGKVNETSSEINKESSEKNSNRSQDDQIFTINTSSNTSKSMENLITKNFRKSNKGSDVQIHVAQINVNKNSDKVYNGDVSDDEAAIEIKINVSRSEKTRRRFSQEKLAQEVAEVIKKSAFITSDMSISSSAKISNQRRVSVPDEVESKRPKRIDKHTRRRHSGGHSYKSYYRRSTDEKMPPATNFNDTNRACDSPSRASDLVTVSEVEITHKDDTNRLDNNNWPTSYRDNPQKANEPTSIAFPLGSNDERTSECSEDLTNRSKMRGNPSLDQSEPFSRSNLDELENIVSRRSFEMTPGPSYSSVNEYSWLNQNSQTETTSTTLDFDNFDVAPNENSDTYLPARDDDDEMSSKMDEEIKNRRLADSEKYRNPYAKPPALEALEINLNTVPIYTTKDGKITYSPNPRYTYKALIEEARRREGYPLLRDTYCPKSTDSSDRRVFKHRNEAFDKRRWSEYNPKRVNQASKGRSEDSGRRGSGSSGKFDSRWRERTSESLEFSNDCSAVNSDTLFPTNYNSMDSTFQMQHHRYYQAIHLGRSSEKHQLEESVPWKRRHSDNFNRDCVKESVLNDKSMSRSHLLDYLPPSDLSKCVDGRILNGQEMELFSKNINCESTPTIGENNERISRLSPLGRNKITPNAKEISQIKWTVPDSIDTPLSDDESKDISRKTMKPPASVDVEADSEAMLTDSGLESSTTYTEGSKEPKRCQKWEKTFLDRENIETAVESEIRAPKHLCKDGESLKPTVDSKKDYIFDETHLNTKVQDKNVPPTDSVDCSTHKLDVVEHSTVNEDEKQPASDKIVGLPAVKPTKSRLEIEKLFLSTDSVKNLSSRALQGLDLAYPSRFISSKAPEIIVEPPKVESSEKIEKKQSSPPLFSQQNSSFLDVRKETPTRRASSDGVEGSKKPSVFYEDISSATSLSVAKINYFSGKNVNYIPVSVSKATTMQSIDDVSRITDSNIQERALQADEKIFEKPEVPVRFIQLDSFNSTTNNSKINDAASEDPPTESEVSHFEDTVSSTQFGSECADSKTTMSSGGVPYLSTSSQEAVDATDLNHIRRNLSLCGLEDASEIKETYTTATENFSKPSQVENTETEKILSFSGRISSESEDDSNAQHGSPVQLDTQTRDFDVRVAAKRREKILSFSGQIQRPQTQSICEKSVDERDKPSDNILTFAGRIPSPGDKSGENLPSECEAVKYTEKNLTFSGKIPGEVSDLVDKNPPSGDKIPKFIIKKSENTSRSSSVSQIYLSTDETHKTNESTTSNKLSERPKIPKMIIRNLKSRPGTPVIEDNTVEVSFPKTNSREQKVFEVKIKLDDQTIKNDGQEGPVRKSLGIIECKVPKMKIKLEDKIPKMIFQDANLRLPSDTSLDSLKNVPRVKIRKVKRSTSREDQSSSKSSKKSDSSSSKFEEKKKSRETNTNITESTQRSQENTDESRHEKIPKLKIRKQDSKPEETSETKKKPSKTSENPQKPPKKSSNRHKSVETSLFDTENTTSSSHQSISEKIPKVIIKRTSASAEFKCELSEDGSEAVIRGSKWQPEVKLERFKVLDSIAKESGCVKLPLKMLDMIAREQERVEASKTWRKSHLKRTSSDPTVKDIPKTERTLSKGKRRHSDPEKPSKSQKTTHEPTNPSSVTSLNNDSDSEIFPRMRRNVSRKLHDDSSVEVDLEPGVPCPLAEACPTASDFEYPSSSQKKNSPIVLTDHVDTVNAEEPETVIKLESSDESQTTIEMLPASPDLSQPESEAPIPLEGKRRLVNGDMAQVYSEEAIPTQFELELEIVDNSSGSGEVSEVNCGPSNAENYAFGGNQGDGEKHEAWRHPSAGFPDDSNLLSHPGPSFDRRHHEHEVKNISCSDLLVKEVLAAKETLKRCLAKSNNVGNLALRPKTAAEKKQGAAFDLVPSKSPVSKDVTSSIEQNQGAVFQENLKISSDNSKRDLSAKSTERRSSKSKRSKTSSDRREKRSNSSSDSQKPEKIRLVSDLSVQEDSRVSLQSVVKTPKRSRTSSESRDDCHQSKKSKLTPSSTSRSPENRSKDSGQIFKVSKVSTEMKPKTAELMPVLEPEGPINFNPSARESSRSPPVITKHDVDPKSPKKVEEKEEKEKSVIHSETEAVSFADIVAQMAYHEKATIKHRRYCILCERWFPTTERHRQHLIGYQHRFTELTQRRTVHALFMLFTGKPCPRLLPASITRTDCVPGEPTPLQIAVQDVAISLEKEEKKKTVRDEDK